MKVLNPHCWLITFILIVSFSCFGQAQSSRQKEFTRDSIPELDLTPDTAVQATAKKKKAKKNVFYGLKTKKGFTKVGKGDKQVIETFHYLKTFKMPDRYIKDIYVYDIKQRKIVEIDELKQEDIGKYKILHGPYKKMVGKTSERIKSDDKDQPGFKKIPRNNTAEMGIFYVGTKHARWELFSKNFVLLDKTRYYRGWQRDAEISYYDGDRKKVKEVLPYKHGSLNGTYYYFLENGQVLHHGKYRDGKKIGLWVEYYKDKDRRRKEVQYPKDPYQGDQFEAYTVNEWNDKGDPVIKNGKPFVASKNARKPTRTGRK